MKSVLRHNYKMEMFLLLGNDNLKSEILLQV